MELACQISGIVKSFGPNQVLKEVDLELPSATITVLMGANGAGKSTLVKILCGVHKADAGNVTLFGENFSPASPSDEFQSGVVKVHQTINNGVIQDLDVASNLMIDRLAESSAGFFLRTDKLRAEARKVAATMDLDLDITAAVNQYGSNTVRKVLQAIRVQNDDINNSRTTEDSKTIVIEDFEINVH